MFAVHKQSIQRPVLVKDGIVKNDKWPGKPEECARGRPCFSLAQLQEMLQELADMTCLASAHVLLYLSHFKQMLTSNSAGMEAIWYVLTAL